MSVGVKAELTTALSLSLARGSDTDYESLTLLLLIGPNWFAHSTV